MQGLVPQDYQSHLLTAAVHDDEAPPTEIKAIKSIAYHVYVTIVVRLGLSLEPSFHCMFDCCNRRLSIVFLVIVLSHLCKHVKQCP